MAKFFTPTRLSENIHETPEGYLICVAVPIGRTGEMIYAKGELPLEADSEGKVVITRDATDVFDPVAMASFEGKPFTIRHPNEFVTPENWKDLTKGMVQNIRKGKEKDEDGNEFLVADILVMDAIAIQMVKRGVREVSCGYDASYEQTGPGRGTQKEIRGNHLALVEEGRAGPSYAINDHKTIEQKKGPLMKWSEKVKNIFAKAVDEAAAVEKEEKSKDEADPEKKSEKKDDKESKDEGMGSSYDELVKACKDLAAKIDGMKPESKDADMDPEKKEEYKPAAKDEEVEGEITLASLAEKMKALEMAVSKIMEGMSKPAGDEDVEEMGDEDPEMLTGDTAARVEILAPGTHLSKDAKAKALKASYATKEGKSVIDSLTGGKAPSFDSKAQVEHLFIATSEILKASRGHGLGGSKDPRVLSRDSQPSLSTTITAEKLNEMNQAFWSQRK